MTNVSGTVALNNISLNSAPSIYKGVKIENSVELDDLTEKSSIDPMRVLDNLKTIVLSVKEQAKALPSFVELLAFELAERFKGRSACIGVDSPQEVVNPKIGHHNR